MRILTEETYKEHIDEINPKRLKRVWKGRGMQLDHKYSVSAGFKNKVCPFIISSKNNLSLISKKQNKKKSGNCSIELSGLLSQIK